MNDGLQPPTAYPQPSATPARVLRSPLPSRPGPALSPRFGMPLGATHVHGGTHFAVWTTRAREVSVRLCDGSGQPLRRFPLTFQGDGVFSCTVPGVGPGALYQFELDGEARPDPYARAVPLGVHGPAQVVDPSPTDRPPRRGVPQAPVLYELHVGTFTPEGTLMAARWKLPHLADLGITTVELMPIAAFAGHRGWGYDGVALYAVHPDYGSLEDLRAFVDTAHDLGLSVVQDVVYNHFGPSGNYLGAYSPEYFRKDVQSPWGDPPDFRQAWMRRYVLDNVRYWLEEVRVDGLRLDATHELVDAHTPHLLTEIAALAAAQDPPAAVYAEDERNDPRLVTEQHLTGLWADDFHHQVHVLLTGERDGYYAGFQPELQALRETILRGWLYNGQPWLATGEPRGHDAGDLQAPRFVYALQNHDQVGNRALGERLNHLVGLDRYCAVSMLLLFLPMTPLLFQGQEWAASTPFQYFTHHDAELGAAVAQGRRAEFEHFASFADPQARAQIPDPQDPATLAASRLDWHERRLEPHRRVLGLYRAMLHLRRHDAVLSVPDRQTLDVQVCGPVLQVERWQGEQKRRLLVHFGREPVPVVSEGWRTILTSDGGEAGTHLGPGTAWLQEA